jgi:hypothetical protein
VKTPIGRCENASFVFEESRSAAAYVAELSDGLDKALSLEFVERVGDRTWGLLEPLGLFDDDLDDGCPGGSAWLTQRRDTWQ